MCLLGLAERGLLTSDFEIERVSASEGTVGQKPRWAEAEFWGPAGDWAELWVRFQCEAWEEMGA